MPCIGLLTDTMPPLRRWQRAAEFSIALGLVGIAIGLALRVGVLQSAALPILWGVGFAMAAITALALARRVASRGALAAAAVLVTFSAADLGWNNAPNKSTGLKPSQYEALRPDTTNETVALLKSKLKAAAAPDRRDRVELIGVAYHWPNIGLIHDFDHLFGHNPLRLMDFDAPQPRPTPWPESISGSSRR